MNFPIILTRQSKPCQYDMLPCGTLCRVIGGDSGKEEIYEQMSEDENVPIWELKERSDLHNIQLVITAYEGFKNSR